MEWYYILILIFGDLLILMATGMPIAFCFLLINVLGMFFFFGGEAGLRQITISLVDSVTIFTLLPLPLFILMGEVMFRSGVAPNMLDALDKWLGRLPGRLGLLAVGGGSVFASLSGASVASTAMLGSVLVPEMEKRGYGKAMSLGPILGSGGLAIMIPPTSLGVLLGAIAQISIGRILIAIIVPGLLMAFLYASYILIRCRLQPSIAPPYDVPSIPFSVKLAAFLRYILPLGSIIFLVTGVIFVGIATPSEAAATGGAGTFLLTATYGRLSWKVVKESLMGTIQITVMMFTILASAKAFSQILAYTEATKGLAEFALSLPFPPLMIFAAMQVVVLVMGMFMNPVAIMMVCIPVFLPIIYNLGFDPVWFAVIILLNIEMGVTSPPFGFGLFVMKGVAPPDTTMEDIYKAALPFLGCDLIVMAAIIAFPSIALWLPSMMI